MKPIVSLINVTSDPIDMLILAKSTRLEMSPLLLKKIEAMTEDEKRKELSYIANTIPASWEFVDFIFMIQNVTRAFTHQFVRGRHASYAQQTMRVLNVDGWNYATGPTIDDRPNGRKYVFATEPENSRHETLKETYDIHMRETADTYNQLIESGAAVEDARGVLPTNILTNILVKMNLRTFVETVRKRSSSRVQGEYREVLDQMKRVSIAACPWVELFVNRTFDRAAKDLEEMILSLPLEPLGGINPQASANYKLQMIKLIDQMRMQS